MSGFFDNDSSFGEAFRSSSQGVSSFEYSEIGQQTADKTTVMNYPQTHGSVSSINVQTQTGAVQDLIPQAYGQSQIIDPNDPEIQKLKSKTSPTHKKTSNSHSFHSQFGKNNQGYHSSIVQATDPTNQSNREQLESKRISYQSNEIVGKKFESQNRLEGSSLRDEGLKEICNQLQSKNEQLQKQNAKFLEQKEKVDDRQNETLRKLPEEAKVAIKQKQNKQQQLNEKIQRLELENQRLQGKCEGLTIAIMNRNSRTSSRVASSFKLINNEIALTFTGKQIVPQEYLVCIQNGSFIQKIIPCMRSTQINCRMSSNYKIFKIKPELISTLKDPHDFLLSIQKDESKIEQIYYSNQNYQIVQKKKPQYKKPAFYLHLDRHKISVSGFFENNWLNLIGLTLVKCSIDDTRWKRISSKAKDHLPHLKLLIIAGNPLEKVQKTDLDNFKSIREIHFSGEKLPQYKEVQKCPLSAESVAQIKKFMQKREKKVKVFY